MIRTLSRSALWLAIPLTLVGLLMLQPAHGQRVLRQPVQVVPAVPPAPQADAVDGSGDGDTDEFSDAISLPKDNTLKKQIEAAVDYIKTEDWVTACDVLQKLVTVREDVFVQMPRKGSDGKERMIWTSVRAEANRLIGTLPKKGLEFYKLTYNPPAQEMLKQAKASSDVSMLAQIMRAYLHTDPGGEATNLLGTYHLDRGNFVTAALCFERLLQREGADRLAPITLFKAAYAFHQSGDKVNEQEVWRRLNARVRDVKIGNESKSIAELQTYVANLVRANAERYLHDWPMVGGKENRSSQGIGGTAFLEPRWKATMVPALPPQESAPTEVVLNWLKQAETQLKQKQPILPAFFPITATIERDGAKLPLIVYRSHYGVHALDMKTGKLHWQTHSDGSLAFMLRNGQRQQAMNAWLQFYVQQNMRPNILFENSVVGTLSTDNNLVYVVDDLAVPPPGQFQAGAGRPFDGRFNTGTGRYGQEVNDLVQHSRLQAFDLSSGKIQWELGSSNGKEALDDCYFLGPPLPLAGKIYVLTEKQQELRLVCINPTAARKPPPANSWIPRVEFVQSLATTRDKIQQDVARRTQAAHLAYGEGILVCPTNAGAILGVDLLSNSLVWAYSYHDKSDRPEETNPNLGMKRVFRGGVIIGPNGRVMNPAAATPGVTQWKVTPPIITDGKVVFTAPDARSIHCLNLRDGSHVWSQKRGNDDLYLAGVFNGKVLIVGKRSVRALNLSTGERAWPADLVTGIPSGHGIASDNVYYLPIGETDQNKDDPEICAIDIDAGRILAHSKSRKKEVPGNLLFYEGDVLSQTIAEVAAFPQLKVKLAEIDALITRNPEDPAGLTSRGELRLDEGNLEGAIADLTKALKHNPEAATRAKARGKLYETLTEYFQRDFNKAEPFLAEYESLCKVDLDGASTDGERAERQAEERRRRANFLCLVAKGKESQRKLVEAFEKYEAFVAVVGNSELISVVDEPTVRAAPHVWSRGRITAMVASATPAERKPLEDRLAARWDEIKKKNDLGEIRRFVDVFGSLFAVGKEGRLYLAERLMEDASSSSLIDAEVQLSQLRGPEEKPEIAARALETLARLYLAKQLLDDAAHCYRQLGKPPFADAVIRDGRTGADFYNEMATDKRLQPFLDPPFRVGANGQINVSDQRGSFPYQHQVYHFEQIGEPLPFFQKHRLALRFDYHQFKLFERATGEERWSQNLTRTMFQNLVYGNGQPNLAKFRYQTLGHLVILPVGHMIFAIDPINKQVLWEKNLYAQVAPLPGQPVGNPPGYSQLIVDPRDGTVQVTYPDGWMQRLGQTGPLDGKAICLQTREALIAVDPLTGQTLWTRSDVSTPRTQIFGDDQHVYVVELNPDGNAATTRCVRLADGVSVDIPDFAPLFSKRQRLVGRLLYLVENDGDGKLVLRLYDVHSGKDHWRETFPAASIQLRSEDTELAGVIEPDGKVRVFDLMARKEVLTSQVDPQHVQKMQSVHLLADGRDYFIACNAAPDPNLMVLGGIQSNLMPGTGLRALPVNGEFYCFDGATGKLRWRIHGGVRNTMLVLDQFENLPMLLFTSRFQKWIVNGPARHVTNVVSVASVDKRTGKRLYDKDDIPNGMNFHALTIDPRAGRIEFIGYQMKIVHQVTEAAAAPPEKVGALPNGEGKIGPGAVTPPARVAAPLPAAVPLPARLLPRPVAAPLPAIEVAPLPAQPAVRRPIVPAAPQPVVPR